MVSLPHNVLMPNLVLWTVAMVGTYIELTVFKNPLLVWFEAQFVYYILDEEYLKRPSVKYIKSVSHCFSFHKYHFFGWLKTLVFMTLNRLRDPNYDVYYHVVLREGST